ncbi:MAG: 50S ribosomal protein L15 [Candidatus Liptonbacteria bacterium]|nr:50S ribosomal protein L15 [Candidatus Liptonbacteria bacterium]
MQLHELQKNPAKKRAQRIGRSGKRGSYSGRGVKGQKSRSGRRIRPAVRDLIIRLPKRRGFRNKPIEAKPIPIQVGILGKKLAPLHDSKAPLVVNREVLQKAGIIPPGFRGAVKILGGGELSASLELHGLPTSKSAKAQIEKAGGKVQ